jgi:hypothetical protein
VLGDTVKPASRSDSSNLRISHHRRSATALAANDKTAIPRIDFIPAIDTVRPARANGSMALTILRRSLNFEERLRELKAILGKTGTA